MLFSRRFSRKCLEVISFKFFVCFIFNVSLGSAPKRKNFDIQCNTRVALGGQFTLNYHTPSHMCRIDECFNFLFKFTATLSKLRSKSKRGSFGTYEFGGSISRRFFSIISHWNLVKFASSSSWLNFSIWGKYFSLISIIFVKDEASY